MIKVNSWKGTYYIQTDEDKKKAMEHARSFRWTEEKKAETKKKNAKKRNPFKDQKDDKASIAAHEIFWNGATWLVAIGTLGMMAKAVLFPSPEVIALEKKIFDKPEISIAQLTKVDSAEASSSAMPSATPTIAPTVAPTASPTVKPVVKPTPDGKQSGITYMRTTWENCNQNYSLVEKYAVKYKIPIQILLAVGASESGCRADARNDNGIDAKTGKHKGIDRGFCQLNSLYHLPKDEDAFDLEKNINYCGLLISNMYIERGNYRDALARFHGGGNWEAEYAQTYATKVLARAGYEVK